MNTSSTADMYLKELQIKTISESQTNQNVKIILYIIPYVCIFDPDVLFFCVLTISSCILLAY